MWGGKARVWFLNRGNLRLFQSRARLHCKDLKRDFGSKKSCQSIRVVRWHPAVRWGCLRLSTELVERWRRGAGLYDGRGEAGKLLCSPRPKCSRGCTVYFFSHQGRESVVTAALSLGWKAHLQPLTGLGQRSWCWEEAIELWNSFVLT